MKIIIPTIGILLMLNRCITDNDSKRTSEGLIKNGYYFILNDADDFNTYTQYFVVVNSSHWEFVEYGYSKSSENTILVQLTRGKGAYYLKNDSIFISMSHWGDLSKDGGIIQSDIPAFPFDATGNSEYYGTGIRNILNSSFEAENFMVGRDNWFNYEMVNSPSIHVP